HDVVGTHGHFPAAARSVDYKGRYRLPRHVPPQVFDNLDSFGDGRAEVLDPLGKVALIDVVRADARLDQLFHQGLLNVRAVIDPPQENGLVAQGHARVGEPFAGRYRLLGELIGVVEVRVDPD